MEPARVELQEAIENVTVLSPVCPIYQNVDPVPNTDPAKIKANLITQLTGAVKWTQTIERMIADGAAEFVEVGPGNVLQGLVKKVNRAIPTSSATTSATTTA
ncbi:Malonyl CoA-acyl carrier protein transacylase [compost metagenome]